MEEIVFFFLWCWIRAGQFTFLFLFFIYKTGVMVIPLISIDDILKQAIFCLTEAHMVDTDIFASKILKH